MAHRFHAQGSPSPGWRSGRSLTGLLLRLARHLLIPLLVSAVPASAAPLAGDATTASDPTPLSSVPPKAAPAPGAEPTGCPARPAAGVTSDSSVLVTLDPDTLWRPRGSEVRFSLSDAYGSTLQASRVQVCMGWSQPPGEQPSDGPLHALVPARVVRPVSTGGSSAVFAATVPDLQRVRSPWPFHLLRGGDTGFTAIQTVPVADMVVAVTLGDRTQTVLLPVGVTSVTYAITLVLICVAGFFLIAWAVTHRSAIVGRDLMLRMIAAPNGYASLSQFQILLWTVTIGACGVYVMVLSGNLINLSSGTLVLLGIAGGAALLARIAEPKARAAPAALVGPARSGPLWSDLVVVGGSIDVTRVQMLVFTMISAAFVILKVVVTYSIPEVPDNFLLLMGISNGIYVAGRQFPGSGDNGANAAGG